EDGYAHALDSSEDICQPISRLLGNLADLNDVIDDKDATADANAYHNQQRGSNCQVQRTGAHSTQEPLDDVSPGERNQDNGEGQRFPVRQVARIEDQHANRNQRDREKKPVVNQIQRRFPEFSDGSAAYHYETPAPRKDQQAIPCPLKPCPLPRQANVEVIAHQHYQEDR